MQNRMPQVRQAMVAAPHYIASAVGASILHKGGNAFDASIAVSAALGVVYPHMTGLGGDSFFLMYEASTGEYTGFNGSGRSGRKAVPDWYTDRGMSRIPMRGIESVVTVPGMADSWWEIWSRYGKLPWEGVLEPAIRYAEDGFPVSENLAEWLRKDEGLILSDSNMRTIYSKEGRIIQASEHLLQKGLAQSLRYIQREGGRAFYEGELMERIISALGRDGGLLTEEDFRGHRGEWVKPISTVYRGRTVYQMPPNSQGFSLLMMLNMLENTELAQIPRRSAAFYHVMTEVIKKAFYDRDAYLTDPDFREIPLERLLSREYAEQLWKKVRLLPPQADPFLSQASGQDTAYAAVVDDEGNAVSFIQSLYFDFGSAYMAGDTGIIMQNRGSYFSLKPASPNILEPNKRCFHTLMPGMVAEQGRPCLLLGTQGGEGQPQTQLSVLTGVIDYGLTAQEAVSLPRWVYGRTWGEDSDTLKLEGRCGRETAAELSGIGHQVEVLREWDGAMGQAQAISISRDGVISGAADPRGDGSVIGW
ncbi:gamma-glutamyltransferase [Paenibacillus tarimensis]|uniref:gamma-glutamyltransferase n=1 Tax=Paenibacillus tarimensis TaxID=416012 RepID=UPI001F160E3A|nr:gamma-glutamyltransferase [Paenibacillus tarimensis]MCF2944738.1 gamma-glutamyltransferase [Paenibacillus tarimensis]